VYAAGAKAKAVEMLLNRGMSLSGKEIFGAIPFIVVEEDLTGDI
jgi:hypothetical protein